VKFIDPNSVNVQNYTNLGFGSAKGLDIFWRDNKTFNETDYWVSYSYVDAKRDYRNFPIEATPSFIAKHNISVVAKRFIPSIRTMFGATYNFASNRPFHNPNKAGFQNDHTPNFHDLSLNAAFLINQHTILYMSSSNVLGRDNVFGYKYASQANESGMYNREAVGQVAKRFIFVGLFITLTKDGKENQLDNL
jgi:outer membrane cobalamin receptor